MSEHWAVEVKIGGKWEVRNTALTKDKLMVTIDLYAGRALSAGYEARIVPYVADEARAEYLEEREIRKV
jgi:hypothetical protein